MDDAKFIKPLWGPQNGLLLRLAVMHPIRRLSVAEQTAGHLRQALQAGRWADGLPGVLRLAAELQVSKKAVRTALLMLEKEGVLRGRGRSRGRMPAGAGSATFYGWHIRRSSGESGGGSIGNREALTSGCQT